ncbi:MAG: peptidylprolyl isomerase [Flavobacteriaceae bacterium]|nr:peptidylprolyl isomerase [Bacteroidia bacterium]NNK87559.1 peptidylprolyl isomerase [Flavobacteriaceae bacterium]
MKFLKASLTAVVILLLFSASSCDKPKYPELGDGLFAEIVTNKGTMVAQLTYMKTPVTVANFVALAEGTHPMTADQYKGKKFYNGLIFHRVMNDFMIQGGCPNGNGRGNPGYRFEDEFDDSLKHDRPGILSMANGGPGTNGSQFFITEKPTPWLDGLHTVFGELVMGQEIRDSISDVPVGSGNKPNQDVVIEDINIVRQGFDARKFDAVKTWETELPKLKERQKLYEEEKRKKEEAERKAAQERAKAAAAEVVNELNEYKSKGTASKSGLISYGIEQGNGPKPKQGQTVNVSYEGYFTDGRLFGSNSKELEQKFAIFSTNKEQRGYYNNLSFPLGPDAPMISGFKEGVGQMSVGDKSFFYIPSHLAWGEQGSPPTIPPNSDVIFIITLNSISE